MPTETPERRYYAQLFRHVTPYMDKLVDAIGRARWHEAPHAIETVTDSDEFLWGEPMWSADWKHGRSISLVLEDNAINIWGHTKFRHMDWNLSIYEPNQRHEYWSGTFNPGTEHALMINLYDVLILVMPTDHLNILLPREDAWKPPITLETQIVVK